MEIRQGGFSQGLPQLLDLYNPVEMLDINFIWHSVWLTHPTSPEAHSCMKQTWKLGGPSRCETHCRDPMFTLSIRLRGSIITLSTLTSRLALLRFQFCSLDLSVVQGSWGCPSSLSHLPWWLVHLLHEHSESDGYSWGTNPISDLTASLLCFITKHFSFISKQQLLSGPQILCWSRAPLQFCL